MFMFNMSFVYVNFFTLSHHGFWSQGSPATRADSFVLLFCIVWPLSECPNIPMYHERSNGVKHSTFVFSSSFWTGRRCLNPWANPYIPRYHVHSTCVGCNIFVSSSFEHLCRIRNQKSIPLSFAWSLIFLVSFCSWGGVLLARTQS